MRKIVQIQNDHNDNTIAVCNDGTFWILESNPLRWRKLEWPEIPQDENKETK